jgi:hypothetical protein
MQKCLIIDVSLFAHLISDTTERILIEFFIERGGGGVGR